MPGPRIYTKKWERLKVAAKEVEARETEEPRAHAEAPEKQKHPRSVRPLIAATAVLAALSILTVSLWIDSQTRLIAAAREAGDFKTRLEVLQEKVSKLEEEKQRAADENGALSVQYEQREAELVRREQELEVLKSRKKRGPAPSVQAPEKSTDNSG